MSASVEQRVVQMVFDNAAFQQGIQNTMQALSSLDDALKLDKVSEGLSSAQKALSGFNLDAIGIETSNVERAFYNFGSIAESVFDRIVAGADLVKNAIGGIISGFGSSILGQIITGGTARATNIERARFQIEGLHGDWDQLSDDINYAVSETAYGFDEAAVAASQFLASQVQAGDDMKRALRGISGAAAMTNSSYAEMANIFTTVAGNGRLMGMQLTQLGMRGMNAAAALKDYFNNIATGETNASQAIQEQVLAITGGAQVTEQTIRDMVSDGLISFDVFAAAMDDTFGDHAKKANETFDGAFANMKASLSRIGAEFVAPVHEGARRIFLGLKDLFNNVKAGLVDMEAVFYSDGKFFNGSIIQNFTSAVYAASDAISDMFARIAKSNVIKDFIVAVAPAISASFSAISMVVRSFAENIGYLFPIFRADFTWLSAIMQDVSRHIFNFGDAIATGMKPAMQILGHLLSTFVNLVSAAISVVNPIFSAFLDVFSGKEIYNAASSIELILFKIEEFTHSLILSPENMAVIHDFFYGLFGIFAKLGDIPFKIISAGLYAISKAFSFIMGFAEPLMSFISGPVFDAVLPVLGSVFNKISDAMGAVGQAAESFAKTNLPKIMEILGKAMNFLADAAERVFSSISSFVSEHIDFEGIWNQISEFFDGIVNYISGMDFGGVEDVLNFIGERFGEMPSLAEIIATASELISNGFTIMGEAANTAGTFLLQLFDKLLGFIGWDVESVVESAKSLGEALIGFKDGAEEFLSSDPLGSIQERFSNFTSKLTEILSSFDPGHLWNDLILGVFTGAGLKFLVFLSDFLPQVLEKKATIKDTVIEVLEQVKSFFGSLQDLTKFVKADLIASTILKIALAIGVLALAIGILASINPNSLAPATAAILAVTVAFAGLVLAMGYATWMADFRALAAMAAAFAGLGLMFIGLGASMLMFANAVKILSGVGDLLAPIAVGLVLVFLALSTILGVVAYFSGPAMIKMGAGLILVAVGVAALVAALGLLAVISLESLGAPLINLAVICATLAVASVALRASGIEKTAAGLVIFAAAIRTIVRAVGYLSKLGETAQAGLDALVYLSAIILLVGFGLKAISKDSSKLLLTAGALIAVAAAVGILTIAVMILSALDIDKTSTLLVALSVAMLAMAGAAKLAAGSLSGGLAIVALSAAMAVLAGVVILLGTVPFDIVTQGLKALASVFLMLGITVAVMDAFSKGAVALSMVVLAISAAFLIGSIGVGILAYNLAMLATVLPGVKQSFGEVFGDNLLQAVANIALVTAGALLLAVGIAAVGAAALLLLPTLLLLSAVLPLLNFAMGDNLPVAAKKATEGLVAFIDGLAEVAKEIGDKAEVFVEAGLKIFRAFVIGVLSIIPEFIDAGMTVMESFLTSVDSHLDVIMERGGSIILHLTKGFQASMPTFLTAAMNLMVEFMGNLAKAITDNRQRMIAAMAQVGAAIGGALLDTLADAAAAIAGENNPITQGLRGAANDLRNAAGEMADSVNEGYAEHMREQGLPATTQECIDSMKGMLTDSIPELGDIGEELGSLLSTNFDLNISDLPKLTDDELDKVQAAIRNAGLDIDIREVAKKIPSEFSSGIASMSSSAQAEVREVNSALSSAGSNAYSIGTTTGYNYSAGVADGVNWGAWLANNAAYAVGLGMDAAAKAGLWERSPSRKGFIVGMNYDLGIAQGVDKYASAPISSTEGMVFGILDATAGLAASIAAEMDELNASPTITPVFDTSSVTEGMAMLDAMMMQKQMMMAGWADAQPIYDPVTQSRADAQAQTVYNTYLDYNADSSATDMVRDMTRKFKMANLLGG